MGSVLCEHCTGQCCRYVALPLDKPATRRDFDDMRWYLLHESVLIFVEDGDWFAQFGVKCRHLMADNRCGIYETRPTICREYATDECEYHAGEYQYDHLFTEPEQLEIFAREFLRKKQQRREARSKKKRTPRRGPVRPPSIGTQLVPLRLPSGAAV
jgi:Fe-S-cluster containining protein